MEEGSRLAVFIDLENFVGSCRNLGLPLDLEPLLVQLKGHGRLQIKRSFGDLVASVGNIPEQRRVRLMLADNMAQHEDIPFQTRYKNSADIRLAVEAISIAYTYPEIDTFAVIASDRDYVPLFNKLRELGRTIIGVAASPESVSLAYRSACDVIYYQEPLLQRRLSDDSEPDAAPAQVPSTATLLLLLRAVQLVEQVGRKTVGTAVSQTMRQLQPDFSPVSYGSFGAVCRKAESMGWLQIDMHGMDLLLELTPAGAEHIQKNTATITKGGTPEPGSMSTRYKRWVEEKLRVSIPDSRVRADIFRATASLLRSNDLPESGISLRDLAAQVTVQMDTHIDTAQCFKLLYGLYRNRAFHCGAGEDAYNPMIFELTRAANELDDCFLENVLSVYRREQPGVEFDRLAWARVWFDDEKEGMLRINALMEDSWEALDEELAVDIEEAESA